MKLNIKPASDVVRIEEQNLERRRQILDGEVVEFINEKVVPEIEAQLAEPERFTISGYVVLPTPSTKGDDFVGRVGRALAPLGYKVSKSHDGGGMYETVVIDWRFARASQR